MIRATSMAALALALMGSAAYAQGASDQSNGPPAQLSGGSAYDDRDRDGPPPPAPPPPASSQAQNDAQNGNQPQDSSRDMYCRHAAAARTGYVTPGEAADHAQTSGSFGGAVGGAALGAIIGGASHAAGPGALIGAGAGLIAGTAIGSDNARHAAADVQAAYSDAYYDCMADRGGPPPDGRYAYGPPAPPPAYYAPYPYYAPPYPYYYGPAIRFGFGFGGGRGGHGHR
jgi:hypothetical protein